MLQNPNKAIDRRCRTEQRGCKKNKKAKSLYELERGRLMFMRRTLLKSSYRAITADDQLRSEPNLPELVLTATPPHNRSPSGCHE